MWFGKEETSTEDKKPCLQGFVPSWSFLTCLRRPYLFPCAGKDMEEKGAWGYVWCILPLNLGKHQCFGRRSTRKSPYVCLTMRRLIRGPKFATGYRRTSAINRRCRPDLPVCTFLRGDDLYLPRPYRTHPKGSPCRGRFPLSGGNVPKGQKG